MSGWGSSPWGRSPWGTGKTTVVEAAAVNLLDVEVLAADLIQLNFSANIKNNAILQSVASYNITALNNTSVSVSVKEVRAGEDVGTDSVILVITPPTLNAIYTAVVVGEVRSLDNVVLSTASQRFKTRRTKIDSLCSTRPYMYDLRPNSILRNLLNAIGREDDRIGGSQNEGEEIIR